MRLLPIIIVSVGWCVGAVLIGLGWYDMIRSVTHESHGLLPAGFMGIMMLLSGLACGLAGNGVASALPKPKPKPSL